MSTVLAIADSVGNVSFDVRSDIRTIVELGMNPLAIVPVSYNESGTCERSDVVAALDYAFKEDVPLATRIGFLSEADSVVQISKSLSKFKPNRVILTPSIISDSGEVMISEPTYISICDKLLPEVNLLVINHLEAELLCGFVCPTQSDVVRASKKIYNMYKCFTLIRGNDCTDGKDFLFLGRSGEWINPVTAREGYAVMRFSYSMAIGCYLSEGCGYLDAVNKARRFFAGYRGSEVDAPEVSQVKKPETKHEDVQTASNNVTVPETIAPTASLVSPAKSLRDIAQSIDFDMPVMPKMPAHLSVDTGPSLQSSNESILSKPYLKTAYTSAIEAPEPKKGAVSDLASQRSMENSLERLQYLRERLNQINQ